MVKTEAPAYAKAAGNSYSLHLPLARLSSTLPPTKLNYADVSIPQGGVE